MHASAHEIACVGGAHSDNASPELKRIRSGYANASKPTHEAGRRGGESTARQSAFSHLFSQPERVAVPCGFALVSVGGAVVSEGVAGF
ncbi:TPA: hypothetical protein MIM69_20325 [Klebsiella variicola]|nr:hypothetical protein [Klebsiella variicola]